MLRLHSTKPIETGHYAALSYCWEGVQKITTTTENLEVYSKGLDLNSLPATVRDAITVTRSLGIRYLWVDALCIVQDDENNKSKEISRMGQIFSSALVTISAATARSAQEGFPADRTTLEKCRLPFLSQDRGGGHAYIGTVLSNYRPYHPIDYRGWTLQEHQLAARLIVYSEKEVIWRCREDTSKTMVPGHIEYHPQHVTFVPANHSRGGRTVKQQTHLWAKIVEQYSQRKFAVLTDKVHALSGIASELARLRGDMHTWPSKNMGLQLVMRYQLRSTLRQREKAKVSPV